MKTKPTNLFSQNLRNIQKEEEEKKKEEVGLLQFLIGKRFGFGNQEEKEGDSEKGKKIKKISKHGSGRKGKFCFGGRGMENQ